MTALLTWFLEFFAVGAIGFWILAIAASIFITAGVENKHFKLPSFIAVSLILCYWKVIFTSIDWRWLGVVALSYGLIGVLYAWFRWMRFGKIRANNYLKKYGSSLTQDQHNSLATEIDVSEHKAQIVAWIAYWPWSFIWNVFGDFFTMLYDSVKGIFTRISRHHLSKFTIKPEPPPAEPTNYGRGYR